MTVPIIGERLGDDRLVILADGGDLGEVSVAAKSLQTLTPLFSKSNPPGALVTELSWPAVVQLATLYGTWWRPQPRLQAWITDQVSRRTSRSSLTYVPPEPMVPRPWQSEGADLIAATGRALITDEPGVGKTASAILGLMERWTRAGGEFGPVVVVCPASVADNWVREWQMWAPHVRANAWRGVSARKHETGTAAEVRKGRFFGTADVYVMSYEMARIDNTTVRDLEPVALIVDEMHMAKNEQTDRTKALLSIGLDVHKRDGSIVGLSGTPITRDVGDFHPLLKLMAPGAWPSKERMISRYALSIPGDYDDDEILGLNPWTKDEFHLCLLGQHRRVAKADVLADLPPKVYTYRTVDLPPKWKKAYDQFEDSLYAELPDGTELSVMDAMSAYTHLSTMSSAPGTVEITYGPDVDEETGEEKRHVHIELDDYVPGKPSWKITALLDLLTERKGLQTVVFAPSRPLLTKVAGPALEHAGFRVGYVVGGQSASARTRDVDAFQARQLDVLLATTGAGGVGLTFTAADTVIVLQRPWELDHSIQLEDRCFGAGTPVLTPDGWTPIEDVKVGSVVVTHTGAQRTVTDAWSQESNRTMADLTITGQAPVTCTADHRFMLADGSWREAGDLRPGDWLAMPGNDVTEELTEMDFEGHRLDRARGYVVKAPETIEVTDDFLYTLGYFAGDGFASVKEGKGRFLSLSGNDTKKAEPLRRCERWAEAQGMHVGKSSTGDHRVEHRAYSAEWAWWFHEAFGGQTGARHKQLPDFVLRLNLRQSQIVLDGLTDSDGYRRGSAARIEYSTMSDVLAGHVALLAMRSGHRPSLTRGSTDQHIVAYAGAPGPRNAGRVTSVLFRHPAKPKGVRERVYDITVEQDDTFVVGSVVVHNCHRIGAEHESIQIIDIIARGTIDTRRRESLKGKVKHLAEVVQDPRLAAELLGGKNAVEHPLAQTQIGVAV